MAGFKKRRVIHLFWSSCHNCDTLWQSDSQLRIVIHNLFAFLHPIYKICLKMGKFCIKKGSFGESI